MAQTDGHTTTTGPRRDRELVMAAKAGDADALSTLVDRHAAPAWRLALVITGSPEAAAEALTRAFAEQLVSDEPRPAHVAFLSALLAGTRRAAFSARRAGLADGLDELYRRNPAAASTATARAFGDLPEVWRSALWLSLMEKAPPAATGVVLGLGADEAKDLTGRAREALARRTAGSPRGAAPSATCRRTVGYLPAYVSNRLRPADLARVDQHIAGCRWCRAALTVLDRPATDLKAVPLALPVALPKRTVAAVEAALGAAALAAQDQPGRWARTQVALSSGAAKASVGGAVAALLVGAIASLSLRSDDDDGPVTTELADSGTELAAPATSDPVTFANRNRETSPPPAPAAAAPATPPDSSSTGSAPSQSTRATAPAQAPASSAPAPAVSAPAVRPSTDPAPVSDPSPAPALELPDLTPPAPAPDEPAPEAPRNDDGYLPPTGTPLDPVLDIVDDTLSGPMLGPVLSPVLDPLLG